MAKILVVDDQDDNRALLVTLINYRGYQAFEAADGAEALALVRSEHPELVISDVLMPTMDGYEFVRQLRADPAIAATEVIFYSAHYREREAHNLAKVCGVSRVLIKPCEPEDILLAIDQALAHAPERVPSPDTREFDREHLRLMTDKLSSKVLELEAMNRRLGALSDLNLQLASEREPGLLLDKFCRSARDLVGAKYAVVCANGQNGDKSSLFTSGIEAALASQLACPDFDRGLLGQVFAESRSRRMTHEDGDAMNAGFPAGYPPLFSSLMAPVASVSQTYGWICLADKLGAPEFTQEDEQILSILAAQVGRIYENGRLYSELQRQDDQLKLEIEERKRTADALLASEAGLNRAQLVTKLTHVITGPDGAFESWPETLPQMIGMDHAHMVKDSREWQMRVHPEDQKLFNDKVNEARAKGARMDLDYRLRRTDGAWLFIRQVMEPLQGLAEPGDRVRWFNTIQDITEQKRAEDELRESDRRFSDLLGNVELLSLMLDREANITYCNDYLLRLTGWQYEEVFGRNWFELFIPPECQDVKDLHAALLNNLASSNWHFENEILTRAGARRLIRWSNTVLRSAAGEVTGTASIGEDITDHKEAEKKIKRLNRVYAVLSGINTLIVRVRNRDELFREACRIAVELGQFKMAWVGVVDPVAKRIESIASTGADPEFLALIKSSFSPGEVAPMECAMTANAVRDKKAVVANDLRDDPGSVFKQAHQARGISSLAFLPVLVSDQVVGLFALYSDETGFFDAAEMKLLTELAGDIGFALDHINKEEQLNYLAYYDEITGLPNRTLFLERVSHLCTHASKKSLVALAVVDIDRFRIINDTFDRLAGDELLKLVAQRIQHSSIGFDTVARVGINSFGVALREPRDAGSVALWLDQLLHDCFATPYRLRDADLRIAGKAGIAMYPLDGDDAETLMRNAEAALKRAKRSAETVLFYTPEMNTRVAEALNLESRLRTALEMDQFVLHYQPKVNLATGKLTGIEALIRWNDPQSGLVWPVNFIPMLEETGLIYEVGRWALHKALEDNRRWRAAGLMPVRIAVNVSPLQLRHRGFIEEIRQAIGGDAQVAAGLELEITESLIMENVNHSIASLHEIRAMGVTIAIDDFGTGFSSLSYLAKLPVDTLKIDRSFVLDMTDGPQGLALVSTIISLAHALKLKVVAEGVDAEEQQRLLRLLGCDEMQGFLFSQPLPNDLLEMSHLAPAL
ncbi:MAG: EAL domain-containing protein [Pseudomonadota bacterium]